MNIRQAKFRFSIVDILTHYKHVVYESGENYKCLCPMHTEYTPSFHVYTRDRRYHCFGCGITGDVITLVQMIEGFETVSQVLAYLQILDDSREDPGSSSKSKSYEELIKENKKLELEARAAQRERIEEREGFVHQELYDNALRDIGELQSTNFDETVHIRIDEAVLEWDFFN